MEEVFFIKDDNIERGKLIYQSQWKQTETSQPSTVFIYEKLISFRQKILPFTFDLRFMTTETQITFYLQEHQLSCFLPKNDSLEWRNHLKKFLNQVGFHEQFKPIKKIGKGNFASVYLVQRLDDKGKYAVKAFSKQAAYSEENGKQCLMKEVDIMRHLNNKHNMKLCEVFQSQNSLYIIFQLLEGGQLFQKIKAKEKFKPNQIKKMVQGILEGLREMHSKNIMHRDLKPQNILFRSPDNYECVIADYGLAQFANSEEYLFVRCGTPGYVAPEVINIKDMKTKYTPICDMFSLGLIFHILLFGKSIFKGKKYNQVLYDNRNCTFDFQGEEYQTVDKLVMDLLKKMLKINPEERITAQEAINHPYFKDNEEQTEEIANQNRDKVQMTQSPNLATGSQLRKQAKNIKKDSCIDLKMGNDNIITGKTETVGTVGSAKISGFGAGLLRGLKASKFSKPSQAIENKQN